MERLELELAPGPYALCRLDPGDPIPSWSSAAGFAATIRTPAELTLLVVEQAVPADFAGQRELGWRGLFVRGQLDFSMVGVLARLSACLAEARVSILALSTFDTDWLFVRAADLGVAVEALRAGGFGVLGGGLEGERDSAPKNHPKPPPSQEGM